MDQLDIQIECESKYQQYFDDRNHLKFSAVKTSRCMIQAKIAKQNGQQRNHDTRDNGNHDQSLSNDRLIVSFFRTLLGDSLKSSLSRENEMARVLSKQHKHARE
jgi:hypothetical protein